MTIGEQWRALPDLLVPPAHDRAALSWGAARVASDLSAMLAADRLSSIVPAEWHEQKRAVAGYFALGAPSHFLNATPHLWSTFHERQITEGLAFFLNADDADVKRKRLWSTLDALTPSGLHMGPDDIVDAGAIAEAKASSSQRIDLLTWAVDRAGERFGAVVEAKFEHELGEHQLRSYRHAAERVHMLNPTASTFTVVAPGRTNLIRTLLKGRLDWRFLSWERLMVRLDERLQALGADESDFSRFRRTVWHRAGN